MNNAFDKLSTQHKQSEFFKDHSEFVEPIEILDESRSFRIGYVVPFEAKLKNLLSIPEADFFDEDQDDLNILISKNIKSNLSDGAYIKEAIRVHKLNRQEENNSITVSERTLYFALYYDDVEVVNPIGSSTKKHKLGKITRKNQ